jgi:hypothetical protein
MARSQLACSFHVPGIADFRRGPMGWPRFHGFSMIAKDLIPGMGAKPFVIMKCLLKSRARKSHPPPQAHFPRVPGTFIADRIIVAVKAVTHDASGRDGNPRLFSGAS